MAARRPPFGSTALLLEEIVLIDVTVQPGNVARWRWNRPVTQTASPVGNLEIDAGGLGFITPTSTVQVAAEVIDATYAVNPVAGNPFQYLSAPTNVSIDPFASFVVPMNGNVDP